jgi:hypothetical protein
VILKLNGTHQLLGYVDKVNLMSDNINTVNKNTETFIDASKEVGPEVNGEKTKYILLSRHQNAGQNQDIKMANRYFELFKYFWNDSNKYKICFKRKLRGD